VTFGVGLASSLNRVYHDISADQRLPVTVRAIPPGLGPQPGPNGGPKPAKGGPDQVHAIIGPDAVTLTAAQQKTIIAAIEAQPGTLHYLSQANDSISIPGLSSSNGGASITAYGDGNPAWSNLALITGTWYPQTPGVAQIDVNTLFLTDTSTAVGGTYTFVDGTRALTAKIVGEVFAPGNDVKVFMSPSTLTKLDPAIGGTGQFDVSLKPGVNADDYAASLGNVLTGYGVNDFNGGGKQLIAVVTLVAMLTLLIAIVAGLGVLNTVALQIREKSHDIGIFKALGMTPRQTLTMVVCSVGITGLVAGIIAVPLGIALHHNVLPAMASAANSGLPGSVVSVFSLPEMIILALAGLVIAVAGALIPAGWAANSRTATALRTE
jgi:putative ABC transport system permease protein